MKYLKWSRLVCAIGMAFIVVMSCPQLFAQSTTEGAIGGLVVDPSAAIVPGATVTARNVATNSTGEAVTDANGRFQVIRLAPGTYAVEVSLTGFAPYRRDNIIVEVGRTTNLDVRLGVAGTTEVVEVVAQSPLINLEQADFSTNINQTTIANLPTNTRRWSTFALMTPGAAPDGNFGLVSFRGISGLLNNNTVDGGDNTQAFFAEERGRTRLAYSLSADAVREFQVTTSNYSAEYGRAAGGVVNAVTKSGTNQLMGSGFYFIRDNKWGASNPFQTQTILQNGVSTVVQLKPDDRRQQFGGTLGGPIQKDKVFFFFSYDQQARKFPGVAAPSNPAAFFARLLGGRAGDLRAARHLAGAGGGWSDVSAGADRRRGPHRRSDARASQDRLEGQQQPLACRHLQPAALGLARGRADRGRREPRRRELGQRQRARRLGHSALQLGARVEDDQRGQVPVGT